MRGAHLETMRGIAGADLSSSEGYVVREDGTTIGEYVVATDDDSALPPVGVLLEGNTEGGEITIAQSGLLDMDVAIAGGSITYGSHKELTFDSNGRLIAATQAGQWIVAVAELRSSTTGSGQSVVVRVVQPYRYAPTTEALGFEAGVMTIAIGQASNTANLGADFAGGYAVATISQAAADGTLTSILHADIDGSGVLTITGNGNADAAVTVAYIAFRAQS